MLGKLLALFIIVPLVELFVLVKLAQATSFWFTVGVVMLTGLIGVLTARVQGWLVWQKIQLDLHQGVMPADAMLEAIILLAAGLLLITPGLLTDGVGFLLLVPSARQGLRDWIKRKIQEMIERGDSTIYIFRNGPR